MSTGDVKCWGLGTSGQLGNGHNYESRLDGTVTGGTDAAVVVPLKPLDTKQNVLAKTRTSLPSRSRRAMPTPARS